MMMLVAAFAFVAGCSRPGIKGDGIIKTEDRSVSEFSKVVVSGGYQIKWSRAKAGLSISTDQNLLPLIKTVVSGKTLKINSQDELAPTKNITIILSSASLADVELSGGNTFKASQLSGPELRVESTGASDITVEGSVTKLNAHLIGASKLNAKSLRTETATLSLVGASHADVAVTDSLKVYVTGAGSVTFSGDPKSVEKNITGAGSIRKR